MLVWMCTGMKPNVLFFFNYACNLHHCEGYRRLAMHIRKLKVGGGVPALSDGAVHRSSGWSAFAVKKQISTSILPQNPLNLNFPPRRSVLMQSTWLVDKLQACESQRISQAVRDRMSSRFLSWVERNQKLRNMFNRWRVCCGFKCCEWINF